MSTKGLLNIKDEIINEEVFFAEGNEMRCTEYKPHGALPHVVRFNVEIKKGDSWKFHRHFMSPKYFLKYLDTILTEQAQEATLKRLYGVFG